MSRRSIEVRTVGVGGAPAENPVVVEDRPDTPLGRHFLVNLDELQPVLAEVSELLADVEPPPGFGRLSVAAVWAIVRDCQCRRTSMVPGDRSVTLAYRPASGDFIAGAGALDTLGMATGRGPVDRGTVVLVDVTPPPSPVHMGQYKRPSPDDVRDLALTDARVVATWYADDAGRTWRAGAPWPSPLEDPDADPAMVVGLSARAVRNIIRAVEGRFRSWPGHHAASVMVFRMPDGDFIGGMIPSFDEPADHWLQLLPEVDDDDPAVLAQKLARVRLWPSGKVTWT